MLERWWCLMQQWVFKCPHVNSTFGYMWNNLSPTECLLLLEKSSIWWCFYLKLDLVPIFWFCSQHLIFLSLLSLSGSSTLWWQQPVEETLHKARPWALQAHGFGQASRIILTCTFSDLTMEMTNKMLRAKKCFKGPKDSHDANRVCKFTCLQYWHAGWKQKTASQMLHDSRKLS